MRGLILKDLLLIKSNLKIVLILLLGFSFMIFKDIHSITFILPFLSVILCVSTFNYDEFNKWDAYAITLPSGRVNVVRSKYLSTLLLVLLSSVIIILAMALVSVVQGNFDWKQSLGEILGSVCGTLLVMSLMYPMLYKFGSEKGRIILFAGVFLLSFGLGYVIKRFTSTGFPLPDVISFLEQYGVIVFPIVIVVVLIGSYLLSEHIYKKKEF